jgi:DNA helicase-2/ATP-dependent DNA helicase PcrA
VNGSKILTATSESIALDPEQVSVIEAPPSTRMAVAAGPGTGKTRTLLARAQWLADEAGVEPAGELLVLSFSRAAVEVVGRRGHLETDLGRLPVRTIDSFAGRLLLEAGVDMGGTSYDGRIEAARKLLSEKSQATNLLRAVKHVLVDEAQDIVGVRASFVYELLTMVCESPEAGFTVFGDSAQAIFDFQMSPRPAQRRRLLELLESSGLTQVHGELKTNHRMENERLAGFASSVGKILRQPVGERDWSDLHKEISEQAFLKKGWSRVAEATAEIRSAAEAPGRARVAVLCRTNAEALWLGCHLHAAGLDVRVQHRAQDRGGAAWLAKLFGDCPVATAPIPLSSEESEERPWLVPPPNLDRVLRHAGLARNRDVDLARLASLLRCGACPEELTAHRDAAISVSTIHRAKGLEYDTVFIVDDGRPCDGDDAFEEAKVIYVAATRARVELLAGGALSLGGPVRPVENGGRVAVCGWGTRRRNRPRFLEVKVSDSDGDWAPESREELDRVQALLADVVSPGDSIELRLCSETDGREPLFDLIYSGESGDEAVVGRTRPSFGKMLKREVLGRTPRRISGLVADIPDTAAMSASAAQRVGLADHGIHLRARAYGLGRLGWER